MHSLAVMSVMFATLILDVSLPPRSLSQANLFHCGKVYVEQVRVKLIGHFINIGKQRATFQDLPMLLKIAQWTTKSKPNPSPLAK